MNRRQILAAACAAVIADKVLPVVQACEDLSQACFERWREKYGHDEADRMIAAIKSGCVSCGCKCEFGKSEVVTEIYTSESRAYCDDCNTMRNSL